MRPTNKRPGRSTLFGAALIAAALAFQPAAAQSTKKRVTALEETVQDLRARVEADNAASLRIDQLERQVQQLTGQVEQLNFQLDASNARLQAITSVIAGDPEMAVAVGALTPPGRAGAQVSPFPGAIAGPGANAGPGAGPTALGPAGLPEGPDGTPVGGAPDPIADQIAAADPRAVATPADLNASAALDITLPTEEGAAYDYASSFLLQGDYSRAQAAYEEYLAAHPSSPRAADARFRLGEIYLATGANAEAADTFISHIRAYPGDGRAAEAYLKLGTAFSRLGQTSQACEVLRTMKAKFPNAPVAVMQRADVEMSQISCS